MGRIISIGNQKGGAGKTTTAVNLGGALAKVNKKVLLVDMDPQNALTGSLGINPNDPPIPTIYNILKEKPDAKLKDIIIKKSDNLFVLPSNIDLGRAEIEFINRYHREDILKIALQPIANDYDFIIIDCPPNLGILFVNALSFSNELIVTMPSQFMALRVINDLLSTITSISSGINPNISITGILITLYESRAIADQNVAKYLTDNFGDKLFKTYIRKAKCLQEAPSFGKTIFEHDPNSNGAEDYINLTNEILAQKGE